MGPKVKISARRTGSDRLPQTRSGSRAYQTRMERDPSFTLRLILSWLSGLAGRSGRARTCDPRFWRPVLYQLSYTPTNPASPRVRAAFKHRGRPDCKGEAQGERLFMPRLLGHSSSSTRRAP